MVERTGSAVRFGVRAKMGLLPLLSVGSALALFVLSLPQIEVEISGLGLVFEVLQAF